MLFSDLSRKVVPNCGGNTLEIQGRQQEGTKGLSHLTPRGKLIWKMKELGNLETKFSRDYEVGDILIQMTENSS